MTTTSSSKPKRSTSDGKIQNPHSHRCSGCKDTWTHKTTNCSVHGARVMLCRGCELAAQEKLAQADTSGAEDQDVDTRQDTEEHAEHNSPDRAMSVEPPPESINDLTHDADAVASVQAAGAHGTRQAQQTAQRMQAEGIEPRQMVKALAPETPPVTDTTDGVTIKAKGEWKTRLNAYQVAIQITTSAGSYWKSRRSQATTLEDAQREAEAWREAVLASGELPLMGPAKAKQAGTFVKHERQISAKPHKTRPLAIVIDTAVVTF